MTRLPLLVAIGWAALTPVPFRQTTARETPQLVAQSLLDADRAFANAAARTDMIAALSTMLTDSAMMPLPQGGFAKGKSAVLAALRALPGAATARASWTPIRAGISADGAHGFTFGYLTLQSPDSPSVSRKYMTYWTRDSGVWRALAYKQGRAPGPPLATTLMPPALPSALVTVRRDSSRLTTLRQQLMRAEDAFSREAQRIGVGNAFASLGTSDAVNMGGSASASFVVSAAAIAKHVARGDMSASDVVWGADTAFIASSGDLGITFGVIREKHPAAGSDPMAGYPFFTIWRRAGPSAPWRYVAE